MKTSFDQFCINVTDIEKAVHFYETVLGFEVTHRIEIPNVTEVVLAGEDGNRIQLAWHHDHEGPIDHGLHLVRPWRVEGTPGAVGGGAVLVPAVHRDVPRADAAP